MKLIVKRMFVLLFQFLIVLFHECLQFVLFFVLELSILLFDLIISQFLHFKQVIFELFFKLPIIVACHYLLAGPWLFALNQIKPLAIVFVFYCSIEILIISKCIIVVLIFVCSFFFCSLSNYIPKYIGPEPVF